MKHFIIAAFAVAALALAGAGDAMAKAGKSGGGGFGSRGSRTHDAPMERTLTPPSAPTRPAGPPPVPQTAPKPGAVDAAPLAPGGAAAGAAAMRPGAAMAPATQPGFFQRNPMMAGIAGGLLGAGIGSMLFGHSPALAAASDAAPGASLFGLLLQLAVIGGLVWLVFRLFRARQAGAAAGRGNNPYMRAGMPGAHVEPALTAPPAQPRVEREFDASGSDQEAFTEILLGVQQAWSDGDLAKLKRYATPEVISFLSEDLSRNAAEGLANKVEEVALLQGDVSESWSENGFDYLTAILTFSCRDYMVGLEDGKVVKGDPSTPVTHTEAWTFVRNSGGGRWLLSAVQQVN